MHRDMHYKGNYSLIYFSCSRFSWFFQPRKDFLINNNASKLFYFPSKPTAITGIKYLHNHRATGVSNSNLCSDNDNFTVIAIANYVIGAVTFRVQIWGRLLLYRLRVASLYELRERACKSRSKNRLYEFSECNSFLITASCSVVLLYFNNRYNLNFNFHRYTNCILSGHRILFYDTTYF